MDERKDGTENLPGGFSLREKKQKHPKCQEEGEIPPFKKKLNFFKLHLLVVSFPPEFLAVNF